MASTMLRLIRQEWDNYRRDRRRPAITDAAVAGVLGNIRREGVHVIPGFWSASRCEEARHEIDRLLAGHREFVWTDAVESDHRLMGADRVSALIADFYRDALCTGVVQAYEGSARQSGFTLASKLVYRHGNPGSGGGWHRDRPDRRQTKAILYLSDVDEGLGPFQYVAGSHRSLRIIRDALRGDFGVDQSRFDDAEVAALVDGDRDAAKTVTGGAGTLILVDTRALHRGMPMRRDGVRYALTNYYWSDADIPEHIAPRVLPGTVPFA